MEGLGKQVYFVLFWPRSHYVAESGPGVLILLAFFSIVLGLWDVSPSLVSVVGVELRILVILSKHFAKLSHIFHCPVFYCKRLLCVCVCVLVEMSNSSCN